MDSVCYYELVGHHQRIAQSMLQTIQTIVSIQHPQAASQIFIGGRSTYKRNIYSEQDLSESRELLKGLGHPIYFHASYCYNLANLAVSDRAMISLRQELETCCKLGGKGVVLHPGSFPDRKQGLRNICKNLKKLLDKPHYSLLLEGPAGERNKLGHLKDIKYIQKKIHPSRVSVCLDTQHQFGAGNYDLREAEEVRRMFRDFEGLDVRLIHLNDSKVPYNAHKDRHAIAGLGEIFYGMRNKYNCVIEDSSLGILLRHCGDHGIDIVTE